MGLVQLGDWELRASWYGKGADIWHVKCATWHKDKGWGYRRVQAVGMAAKEDQTKCWYCEKPVPPEVQCLYVFYNR